jgi:hypothetical protein
MRSTPFAPTPTSCTPWDSSGRLPRLLRQRLDTHADAFTDVVIEASIAFLRRSGATITPLANGLVPVDADVTPFDYGKTKKEGVSRADQGSDGFAPMAAYLGQAGWCLEFELREGRQHCQKGTPELLARVWARARRLTDAPLLALIITPTMRVRRLRSQAILA